MATLHYASGDNIDDQGNYTPAEAGFNLADVTYVDQVNELPSTVQGLVWLNQYSGVTQDFINAVTPFLGNPKVYGFFLVDEPDPTGQYGVQVSAADLKAESDWIHSHDPGAKTFITMMNMGSADAPDYTNTYTPENTHVDLFGIDWYPVWSDTTSVDYSMIDKYVAAAVGSGIPVSQIVPTYQTFGGGDWVTEDGSRFVMPTAAQEQQMLDHWASAVPNAAFDYAYAWGTQDGDTALESSPELQKVFLAHNTGESAPVVVGSGTPPPVVDPTTPPVTVPPVDSGNNGGDGSHHHHSGLDFSQMNGSGSSWAGHGHSGGTAQAASVVADTAASADTTPAADVAASPIPSIVPTSQDMHHADHHAWHW